MTVPASFLLVLTLMTATAAGAVSEVRTANADAAHMQQLRAAAGRASSIGPAILTLAATTDDTAFMADRRAAAGRASSIGPAILTLAAN